MTLTADLRPRARKGSYSLVLTNGGNAQISDLDVSLDGEPITEHHDYLEGANPGASLQSIPPHNSVEYRLIRSLDSPKPPLDLHLEYVDSGGREREFDLPLMP